MDEWDFPPAEPNVWLCQECGHKTKRQWPTNYAKWASRGKAATCPECKSEALMPHGM